MKSTDNQDITNVCIPRDTAMKAAMMRLKSVNEEIRSGYKILTKYEKTATVFGSARLPQSSPYYKAAKKLSYKLVENGYAVISGGGHGIMEAANEGASQAGGASIGFNIKLPHEQTLNPHTTDSLAFSHFAPRKIVMTLFANAYIYFPGGFGTLDELTEILTLIQTGKATKAPVILFGSDFWKPFDSFVKKVLLNQEAVISPGDEHLYIITDDIDEAMQHVIANQTYCEYVHTDPNTKRSAKMA
jgi:uncharacterized protein (TIGR00730 family)